MNKKKKRNGKTKRKRKNLYETFSENDIKGESKKDKERIPGLLLSGTAVMKDMRSLRPKNLETNKVA